MLAAGRSDLCPLSSSCTLSKRSQSARDSAPSTLLFMKSFFFLWTLLPTPSLPTHHTLSPDYSTLSQLYLESRESSRVQVFLSRACQRERF